MTKLSKEKRDKLILAIVGVLGALGVLHTFVLGSQQDQLAAYRLQILSIKDKVGKAERLVKSEELVARNLEESRQALAARTSDMSQQAQAHYRFLKLLDEQRRKQGLPSSFITEITPPEFQDVGLLPQFPFRAASFGVRVSGHFAEIGRFIADLENNFPYFRVQLVRMAPAGALSGSAAEALLTELRVVTLLNPGTT
jgi:hypothetical protein